MRVAAAERGAEELSLRGDWVGGGVCWATAQANMEARLRAASADVRRALQAEIGDAPLSEQWLYVPLDSPPRHECVTHLWSHSEALRAPRALHQATRAQLLASRLQDSMECGVLTRPLPPTMLLQVIGMTDVGVSAQTLLDTLYARQSEPTPRAYPRHMLRMELSDGFHEPLIAFEDVHIPTLALGETRLGCKLLLHRVQLENGVVFLTPDHTTVLGGAIPSLAQRQERILEEGLCTQLNVSPKKVPNQGDESSELSEQPAEETPAAPAASNTPAAPLSHSTNIPSARASPPLDMAFAEEWDIDAEQALLEAEMAMTRPHTAKATSQSAPPSQNTQTSISTNPTPVSSGAQKSELLRRLEEAPTPTPLTPPPVATTQSARTADASDCLKIPSKHIPPQSSARRSSPTPIPVSSDTEPERTAECIVLSDSDSVG